MGYLPMPDMRDRLTSAIIRISAPTCISHLHLYVKNVLKDLAGQRADGSSEDRLCGGLRFPVYRAEA